MADGVAAMFRAGGNMTHTRFVFALLVCVFGLTITVRSAPDPKPGVDWPSFRGIRASGVADGFQTLTTWDVAKKAGIRWRTPLQGLGTSSPIVWANRVCVTAAI